MSNAEFTEKEQRSLRPQNHAPKGVVALVVGWGLAQNGREAIRLLLLFFCAGALFAAAVTMLSFDPALREASPLRQQMLRAP